MAAALEVFRRHALEVQRLNLVEQLAEELQGKNAELESVLAELRKVQDQIVMREKLAALGELTAGVAHEIRNPLNFVNNFSEASGELITELQEVLNETGVDLSDDQRTLVTEITNDLTSNVGRIRAHGERANRIVRDMLMMGRGSGEWQATDVNALLDQHSLLAYHSARATDPEFQLELKQDFDPEAGTIEVIPQDLGRVFLNMVSNACHATDENRRSTNDSGMEAGTFTPTLWLVTRREGDHIEIRIRDNGTGIPPDVVDKIFNPFFTTKPTHQGTGLGLAISSDIVRRHGGTIRVDSQPGEFTEMIVSLPLERPTETPKGRRRGPGLTVIHRESRVPVRSIRSPGHLAGSVRSQGAGTNRAMTRATRVGSSDLPPQNWSRSCERIRAGRGESAWPASGTQRSRSSASCGRRRWRWRRGNRFRRWRGASAWPSRPTTAGAGSTAGCEWTRPSA